MVQESTYQQVKLDELDTALSVFRLIRPDQIKIMVQSMGRLGQLQPVIIQKCKSIYQIIDGFKRYFAAEQLGFVELYAKIIDTTEAAGKAMILNYNRGTNSLVDYEEAMVVCSLKKDHLLNQKEISLLLGCSTSWVCRRLSLIERLEESVQSQLRLGKITVAHAREIVKLPRGNQISVTRSIIGNNVTSRQSALLVEMFLKSMSKEEQEYLLRCPVEAIEKSGKERDTYDCRLGKHGNRLLKTIEILTMQQHIFIGQFTHHQTTQLTGAELNILDPKFKRLSEKSNTIQSLITKILNL